MTETRRLPLLPLLAVVLLVAIGSGEVRVRAQAASTISGTVRDATGSLLPGVMIPRDIKRNVLTDGSFVVFRGPATCLAPAIHLIWPRP